MLSYYIANPEDIKDVGKEQVKDILVEMIGLLSGLVSLSYLSKDIKVKSL